ncbi:rod shape-determining protein MreC [Prochlorococcus marinus]|uniref:Cell shape-determining protein MreC n=1 Tax=Prochlorococcus marinus XMU1408 TaxID=2213228 RepID=A0A318R0J3_PROMR|nr:rod shape-determining protein MreC [Prochlorococcus marinus]MBW3042847.1 rod shape-determining protein MreC [Prochlorococcus marinus str. XMU1408]PYE00673.1 rod shape-determining protein MreC [Prochlorococcus marinus XMU1408]
MIKARRNIGFHLFFKSGFWGIFLLCSLIFGIRWTKGAGYLDFYSLLVKPILPGKSQKEWIQEGHNIEKNIRLKLLEEDNVRLRRALSLKEFNTDKRVSAAVVSRSSKSWWQQLEINKGAKDGISKGQAVIGPGGLIGLIDSTTLFTARVRLLTDPGHQVGAWIGRTKRHGILTGMGTNRPKLIFLNKNSLANVGDAVTTSPASTLLPPNLIVGIVQFVDEKALPAPYAIVQLTASPEAIDWVQVFKNND